jgi:hypothetical protein
VRLGLRQPVARPARQTSTRPLLILPCGMLVTVTVTVTVTVLAAQAGPAKPTEETATFKHVRQARRHELWRVAHPSIRPSPS